MKIKLFLKNISQDSTYSFVSVQTDYNATPTQAFDFLTLLVRNSIIAEKENIFVVVADEQKLSEFKTDFEKSSEYEQFADNDDDDEDENDEGVSPIDRDAYLEELERENEEERNAYYDIGKGKEREPEYALGAIKKLKKDDVYLPFPKDSTLYIKVSGFYESPRMIKINLRHSVKQFLENISYQDPELLKPFFEKGLDYRIYRSNKKSLDLRFCHFYFGEKWVTVSFLKWNKPIIKQPYVYSSILESLWHGEDFVVNIELACKEKYRKKALKDDK